MPPEEATGVRRGTCQETKGCARPHVIGETSEAKVWEMNAPECLQGDRAFPKLDSPFPPIFIGGSNSSFLRTSKVCVSFQTFIRADINMRIHTIIEIRVVF